VKISVGATAVRFARISIMMKAPHSFPTPGSRVHEIVVGVLSATVLALVAVVSVAQFASY
jgi:hypothetical protein